MLTLSSINPPLFKEVTDRNDWRFLEYKPELVLSETKIFKYDNDQTWRNFLLESERTGVDTTFLAFEPSLERYLHLERGVSVLRPGRHQEFFVLVFYLQVYITRKR